MGQYYLRGLFQSMRWMKIGSLVRHYSDYIICTKLPAKRLLSLMVYPLEVSYHTTLCPSHTLYLQPNIKGDCWNLRLSKGGYARCQEDKYEITYWHDKPEFGKCDCPEQV